MSRAYVVTVNYPVATPDLRVAGCCVAATHVQGMMIEDVKKSSGATSSPGNVTLAMAFRCLDATQGFAPAKLYEYYMANTLEKVLCQDEGQPCRRKQPSKPKKGRKAKKREADDEAAYVVSRG